MSNIPEVLDALVQLARLMLPDDVEVFDGPPDVNPLPDKFVVIGWDPTGGHAVETEIVQASLGPGDVREQSAITCGISLGIGETTIKAVRDEAVGLYKTFRAALASNQNLSGLVLRAMSRFAGLDQAQTESGCAVDVLFVIDVLAFER